MSQKKKHEETVEETFEEIQKEMAGYETVKRVEQYMREHFMIDGVRQIVAGVSGGPDSMCLLHILLRLQQTYGYKLDVVHIHHGIRGKEADRDMEYVESYCKRKGIPFHGFHYRVQELAEKEHMSTEEMGRKVRYQAFQEVLKSLGEGKIAVAHNRDDVSETMLFHLFRGTGIRGLASIPPARDEIIRPVLCLGRKEILAYLKINRIDYKTDTTNQGEMYSRNKIRNRILPYVESEINTQASEHIFQTAGMLRKVEEYMDMQAQSAYREVSRRENCGSQISLDVEKFKVLPDIIGDMVIRQGLFDVAGKKKDISMVHIRLVRELIFGGTGRTAFLPYQIKAEREYQVLRIRREKQEPDNLSCCVRETFLLTEVEKRIFLPPNGGYLEIKLEENVRRNYKNEENIYTKWMDYDILKYGFEVRTRKSGDYIVVNPQGGRKKLKDFFIDRKIPRGERDKILLLAKDSEVFWILGYRLSERCKVTENTKYVVSVRYIPQRG